MFDLQLVLFVFKLRSQRNVDQNFEIVTMANYHELWFKVVIWRPITSISLLCLSFLPRTLSLLPVWFCPPLWAQMPHTSGSHRLLLCILASCQTAVFSWQWQSLSDLEGHTEPWRSSSLSLKSTQPVSTIICEVEVKVALHNNSCHHIVFFQSIWLFQLHFLFPSLLRILHFPSLENPPSETQSLDK